MALRGSGDDGRGREELSLLVVGNVREGAC